MRRDVISFVNCRNKASNSDLLTFLQFVLVLLCGKKSGCSTLVSLIDDRLYSAILRSLEQNHCARMWFYMSD